MLKKLIFSVFGLLFLVAPLYVFADQINDLQAQVQSLLAQIVALKGHSSQPSSAASAQSSATNQGQCVTLSHNLHVGSTDAISGGDVTTLQRFLIDQGYLHAAATGYFGALTQAAVQRWQADNAIVSSGTPASTGWGSVGPKTRGRMDCEMPSSQGSAPAPLQLSGPVNVPSPLTYTAPSNTAPSTSPTLTPSAPVTSTPASVLANTSSVQYLGFNSAGVGPALVAGASGTPQSKAQLEAEWGAIISAIGQKGDGVHAQLGFWVGPLGWDITDAQQKQLIDDAFAVAEEKNVAVGFHIDDSMFWNSRSDLWNNSQNVEWSDWNGTAVPHRIIGWVDNSAPVLAPPMCYNSPAIVKEATRIAISVIGAEIKKNVDYLHSIGKDYLFMGVIAGWETRLQDDSAPPVFDGYCALHNLGYSAANPPADADKTLNGVVANWITLWTKNLSRAGIPIAKIFTHVGTLGCTIPPNLPPGVTLPASFDIQRMSCKDADPDQVAFNAYSNPGFTMGPDGAAQASALLSAHGNLPWGVSEGEAVPTTSMEQYLAGVFNHGGVYMNIFDWPGPGTPRTAYDSLAQFVTGASSVAAYQKFLAGQTLQ